MAQGLIPSIGTKGNWSASAPFDTILSSTSVYECVGARKLAEIMASGEDGYVKYYKASGATFEDYVKDVQAGVCIISLVSGNGQWCYIPHTKLAATPSMAGVKYSRVVIGVQLGEVPEIMDLTALTDTIEQAVHHFLAITVGAQIMVTSATVIKTQEEHDARMAGIAAMRNLNKNDYTRNIELTAEITSLRNKLLIAERYILDHR